MKHKNVIRMPPPLNMTGYRMEPDGSRTWFTKTLHSTYKSHYRKISNKEYIAELEKEFISEPHWHRKAAFETTISEPHKFIEPGKLTKKDFDGSIKIMRDLNK